MTLPDERARALWRIYSFVERMAYPRAFYPADQLSTKMKELREEAKNIMRHAPLPCEIEDIITIVHTANPAILRPTWNTRKRTAWEMQMDLEDAKNDTP